MPCSSSTSRPAWSCTLRRATGPAPCRTRSCTSTRRSPSCPAPASSTVWTRTPAAFSSSPARRRPTRPSWMRCRRAPSSASTVRSSTASGRRRRRRRCPRWPSPDGADPHGRDRLRQTRGDALPSARALPGPQPSAGQPGNRQDPPDPRPHGARRPPTRGRSRLWRSPAPAGRMHSGACRGAARVPPAGACTPIASASRTPRRGDVGRMGIASTRRPGAAARRPRRGRARRRGRDRVHRPRLAGASPRPGRRHHARRRREPAAMGQPQPG